MMRKPDPMQENTFSGYRIILASGSPRRRELMQQLGIPFEVQSLSVEEVYPEHLEGSAIAEYLAKLKASAGTCRLQENDILITADTIVWHANQLLGKPASSGEAIAMLQLLSGEWHEVITSVCATTPVKQQLITEITEVKFRTLDADEIRYYVDRYHPLDKAGGYGIQEWIGLTGIEEIRGSYPNVVGLPTHRVYDLLRAMVR